MKIKIERCENCGTDHDAGARCPMCSTETKEEVWRLDDHGQNCGNAIRFEITTGSGDSYQLLASIEVEDARQAKAIGELMAKAPELQSQLAQLTREVEAYRAACKAVVKADLLCNDGSISNQIEAAIEQAHAALAMGKEK